MNCERSKDIRLDGSNINKAFKETDKNTCSPMENTQGTEVRTVINSMNILDDLSQSPKLFVYLTTNCNLTCKHCYLGDRLQRNETFLPSDVLNLLDLFSELTGNKDVTFLGGEPLLYPETNEILKYAKEKGYYVRLDTNGSFNKKRLNLVDLESVDEISFSLDGSKPVIHDAIRAPGSFSDVIRNVINAKERGCRVRIITTVMKQNLCDLPNLVKLVKDLNIDLVNLHLVSINGNARKYPEIWISPEEWLRLVIRIWNIKEIKIRFPLAYIPQDMLFSYPEMTKEFLSCEIPELRRLSLFPDGRVYCCSLLFDTNLNVGKYDITKGMILKKKSSELNRGKLSKRCIARDYAVQKDGFLSICRFIKLQNDENEYNYLIKKLEKNALAARNED